jgi:hypothetical protein
MAAEPSNDADFPQRTAREKVAGAYDLACRNTNRVQRILDKYAARIGLTGDLYDLRCVLEEEGI